ncbi:uncharacterized protein N7482_004091 [Penicillium canariense]|uniref:Uncharacterized protein n=1 Tax=Penicillium canariense TaxID=189055 RepID=A0A9W9IBP7_9EURO|nr:uncharacterized protein N7482_004091 [Penicillium canariense]KAJ5168497.1 hypothetical protein N7482_004091 [Penicillium canariense]
MTNRVLTAGHPLAAVNKGCVAGATIASRMGQREKEGCLWSGPPVQGLPSRRNAQDGVTVACPVVHRASRIASHHDAEVPTRTIHCRRIIWQEMDQISRFCTEWVSSRVFDTLRDFATLKTSMVDTELYSNR